MVSLFLYFLSCPPLSLSLSFLPPFLFLIPSFAASLCFCEAQVTRFVCFPTAPFYPALRVFLQPCGKNYEQQNIFMAYYCEIMVGGGLKQQIGMGFDECVRRLKQLWKHRAIDKQLRNWIWIRLNKHNII